MQDVALVVVENVPAVQSEHLMLVVVVASTTINLPGGHVLVAMQELPSLNSCSHPVGHIVQVALDIVSEYVPARQTVHCWFCCTVGGEIVRVPIGHTVHVLQLV